MRALVEVAEIELGIHLRQLAMIDAVNVAILIGRAVACFPDISSALEAIIDV